MSQETLQRYGTRDHSTGVTHFGIVDDGILLLFQNGAAYLYTNAATGSTHVRQMQRLAHAGKGLSSYVSRNVGSRYAASLSAAEVAALQTIPPRCKAS